MGEEQGYTKGVRSVNPDYIWGWNTGHTVKITKDMSGDEKVAVAKPALNKLLEDAEKDFPQTDMAHLEQGFIDGYNTLVDEVNEMD